MRHRLARRLRKRKKRPCSHSVLLACTVPRAKASNENRKREERWDLLVVFVLFFHSPCSMSTNAEGMQLAQTHIKPFK